MRGNRRRRISAALKARRNGKTTENISLSLRVPDAVRHSKAMRSIADHAAPQSRDRNEARRLVRSRFCEAPLRAASRPGHDPRRAVKTKPPTCLREWAVVSPSGEGGACA